VHGITTERARAEGLPLETVLDLVAAAIEQAGVLIAHNIAFDEKVLGAEFLRAGRENPLDRLPHRCTMTTAVDICRLPGLYGFKWPKLSELHQTLFGEGFEGAHQAIADVRACARCYHELRRRGTFA
jgi:DNA polymerase III epsilon subunit-like protein